MENYKDNSRKFDKGENCMQRHLYEHFQLTGYMLISAIPMLLSLIKPRHLPGMKIAGYIPLNQNNLWEIMLKRIAGLLSYIVIEQLFRFLDLDILF